jgi:hypothetical protein
MKLGDIMDMLCIFQFENCYHSIIFKNKIYKTIFPGVKCEWKNISYKYLKNIALRKVSGPKRDEVHEQFGILHIVQVT